MSLTLQGVHAAYGPAEVLRGVDLDVPDGSSMVLVGRNGMGKTSTMRCIMGIPQPTLTSGTVRVGDTMISGGSSHEVVQQGVAYVPQGRRIFGSLSVRENLRIAAIDRVNSSSKWSLDGVYDLYPRLAERSNQLGGTLSGGEQQMLAVGRALMSNPRILLLDEPSEGLAPLIVRELLETLVSLRATGMTILMAEQNFAVAQRMADQVAVMERGAIAFVDEPARIAEDQELQKRYLGV